MPTYVYEAMDATGMEIRDTIEAPDKAAAQSVIRQRGYFVTRIYPKNAPLGDYSPHTPALYLPFLPQVVAGVLLLVLGILIGMVIGMNLFPS